MEIKYNNSVVRIQGKIDRKKLEIETIKFMTKVQRSKKNEHDNKTRIIKEK